MKTIGTIGLFVAILFLIAFGIGQAQSGPSPAPTAGDYQILARDNTLADPVFLPQTWMGTETLYELPVTVPGGAGYHFIDVDLNWAFGTSLEPSYVIYEIRVYVDNVFKTKIWKQFKPPVEFYTGGFFDYYRAQESDRLLVSVTGGSSVSVRVELYCEGEGGGGCGFAFYGCTILGR